MAGRFNQHLTLLAQQPGLLTQLRRGLEKESLRINRDGSLAKTPHPHSFGSALTHPSITTDFSEALLEFITPVSQSINATLQQLDDIHRFTYANLGDELLWPASMPCALGDDDDIPVAQYGQSNIARMKTLYRIGLGHRYGRRMQTIAGIHYNFSVPEELWQLLRELEGSDDDADFVTESYFGLIRNFRRYAWLLIYLFGSAPAICRSFLNGRKHSLQTLGKGTLYMPFGTSLRMGDLGYQSDAQRGLNVCYNELDNYIQTLRQAIVTEHPDYRRFSADQQLSAGLLQIENEFYSPIRPKRVTESGEIPLGALRRAGVEYIEVRCIDVNPDHPLGIDADQMRFLDIFLLYCLLQDSPPCEDSGNREIAENLLKVVDYGRDPELQLGRDAKAVTLPAWAAELLDKMSAIAELLDSAHGGDDYRRVCAQMLERVRDPGLTPSARQIETLRNENISYFEWVMSIARKHAENFRQRPLDHDTEHHFVKQSVSSLQRQAAIEAADEISFSEHLRQFYQQYQQL